MDLLIQGLLIGATLTVMIGPITLTILDSSLTGGIPYGLVAAFGMWCSDLIYISLCYFGAQQLKFSLQSEVMTQWIGLAGGVILITIGIFIWRSRSKQISPVTSHGMLRLSGHWMRGFVVNTFAPFSLLFWPTITLTIVIPAAVSTGHGLLFYTGIMASIITGDILKAVFAGWIRQRISPRTVSQIRTGLAVLFVAVGLFSLGKVGYDVML